MSFDSYIFFRLLRCYKNETVILPIKKHSEPKEIPLWLGRFPYAIRKEPKIKVSTTTDYWKYKKLYYYWWRYILNNMEYFSLRLWILNRMLHKDSIILKLFPHNYDTFKIIRRNFKTLKSNAIEFEKNKCDSKESQETLKSFENVNEFLPLSQV